MKRFYKLVEDGFLSTGSGTKTPDGYSEDWSVVALNDDGDIFKYYKEIVSDSVGGEVQKTIYVADTDKIEAEALEDAKQAHYDKWRDKHEEKAETRLKKKYRVEMQDEIDKITI